MMKTGSILAFSLVALAFLCSVGIAAAAPANPDNTQAVMAADTQGVGPGHSLYGLRIAFEDLDESFTFNESELLEKQISHADIRLAELKRELAENRTESADRVLELYRQKLNQTEHVLGPYAPNGTGNVLGADNSALEHARDMIAKHQAVLGNLVSEYPDNPGLGQAYNNSLALEQKFQNRIEQRIETRNGQVSDKENPSQIRQQANPDAGKSLIAGQDTGNRPAGTNSTSAQGGTGPQNHGNGTWQEQEMNQTMTGNNNRNANQNFPQASNQTAGNQQQTGADNVNQNGQGNYKETTGNSQNGNTVNPGNTRNGISPTNNDGTSPGNTRNTGNSGGQGQNTDQRARNR
jgi:hypothetical protein